MNGFGNLDGEFWLGNDNIHILTANHDQKMKVELTASEWDVAYADYGTFSIGDAKEEYLLNISDFSGADPPGLYSVKI